MWYLSDHRTKAFYVLVAKISENQNENKPEKTEVESFCTSAARLVNIPYLWTGICST